MIDIEGLATGIGSLPYKDAEASLDLIFKYTPHIPFWPQLPRRDIRERMTIQFSQGLPCIRLNQKELFFDISAQEEEVTLFYERIIANDIEHFKITPDYAVGFWRFLERLSNLELDKIKFIKGQTVGPFTFAASISDEEGKLILHNPVFFQIIREGLAMKALWQLELLNKFGRPTILFLDEPYLSCLGSGFAPINRDMVVAGLREFVGKIKSAECLIGVHCCGNTDWSIFTEITNIDIISFDAFNFLERVLLYAEELAAFFHRGGILAWGIVPTEGFESEMAVAALTAKLNEGLRQLVSRGINEELLRRRLLVTPSCGLGTLIPDKAELIFRYLSEISSDLQRKR